MRKLIVILIALMAYGSQALADKVTFTASAPDVVVVGEQFKLSFTVTTQNVKEFQIPAIKEGFDVLMGPSSSKQSSTQIINGNVTSSSIVVFTYILMATNVGEYTIPGAAIVAEGNQMVSNLPAQAYLIKICLLKLLLAKQQCLSRKHLSWHIKYILGRLIYV